MVRDASRTVPERATGTSLQPRVTRLPSGRATRLRMLALMRLDLASLAATQSAYYLVTGAVPFVSMRAFEAVTGPKRDHWLVRTVGLLALGFGGLLARDAAGRRPDPIVGIAGAAPFAVASLWYGGTGRISRIYLLDGGLEAAFVVAWLIARHDAGRRQDRPGSRVAGGTGG
jgi:hypothetical protein